MANDDLLSGVPEDYWKAYAAGGRPFAIAGRRLTVFLAGGIRLALVLFVIGLLLAALFGAAGLPADSFAAGLSLEIGAGLLTFLLVPIVLRLGGRFPRTVPVIGLLLAGATGWYAH